MLFQGRYDKARKLQKERMQGQDRAVDEENLEDKIEKNDTLAMILSALLVFLPAAILILGAVALLGYLFVVRP
ncbi:MAG: hypothetical protein IJ246_05605 [Clostridia bacterium]|nr:hypothetical protein [Clostridia bacterium]